MCQSNRTSFMCSSTAYGNPVCRASLVLLIAGFRLTLPDIPELSEIEVGVRIAVRFVARAYGRAHGVGFARMK